MNTIYKKLAIVLVTSTAITLPPAQAEIPFTQALGVYQNTKENKKHFSPFWGFVALHGKMLETIRFFGNYSKNIMEEPDEDGNMVRHEADVPKDAIAGLIKRLFNSPDGVQFVATDYEADPVGNLSRNLPAINNIIEVLINESVMNKKGAETKILEILTQLSPPVQKISQRKQDQILYNLEKSSILSKKEILLTNEINELTSKSVNEEAFKQHKIEELQTTHYAQLLQIAKDINVNDLSTMTQGERKKLITQLQAPSGATTTSTTMTKLTPEERAAIAAQKKAEAAKLKAMTPEERKAMAIQAKGGVDFKNLSDQELWKLAGDRGAELEKKAEKILRERIADKSFQDHVEETKIAFLKKMAAAEGVAFNETTSQADLRNAVALKRSLPEIKEALSKLTAEEREKKIKNVIEIENTKFAILLVDAYAKQFELANPGEYPNTYLYPENIVVTALLAFFVKVANNKTELNALPFLMDEPFKENTAFTNEQYFQNKQYVNQIIQDSQNNPEPAFLMAKGFEAFESSFSQPVNYLGSTPYRGQFFPDCGETSLKNVLEIFLSANNGGVISSDALASLQQKIKFPTNMPLENSPFSKLMTYFRSHSNLTSAASDQSHAGWADVVSDLNQDQAPTTLNDVRYGRLNDAGINTYEIKSNVDPDVKGIVNMFNVIAKLIPDEILNEPWSANKEERLQQISNKLDRFCDLLSWGNLNLSWENKSTRDNKIDNEFVDIIFKNNYTPVLKWQFVPGHFQLDPVANAKNDWRINFRSAPEKTFSNEWMAALFLKADEDKWLINDGYGSTFPLSFIYSRDLLSTDGALKILSFVLYRNVENKSLNQFSPLISRWIEKSIPLNDPYSLNKISLLFYSCNNFLQIKNILIRNDFKSIKDKVNQFELLEKTDPNTVLSSAVEYGLNTGLYLISKRPGQWTSLNLMNNHTITDTGIANLKNLTSLDLVLNIKITDAGLANLTNLTSLNLHSNAKITDAGLANLTNLTSLSLHSNAKITDAGLANLTNLTILSLNRNRTITDAGLANLTNLTSLRLDSNEKITDAGLVNLKNLTSLDLSVNNIITDAALANLTNLTSLDLQSNAKITNDGIANLTNLMSLNLNSNKKITDGGLANLTNLTSLSLAANNTITDGGLANLTNLRSLSLNANDTITDGGLANLKNLTSLNLNSNDTITDAGLANLTNLTSLNLGYNYTITDAGLANLTNLTSLNLNSNAKIKDAGIDLLPNLKELYLTGNNKITNQKVAQLRARGVEVIGR